MGHLDQSQIFERKKRYVAYDPVVEFYGVNDALDKLIIKMYLIFSTSIIAQNFSSTSTLVVMIGCGIYLIYFSRGDITKGAFIFSQGGGAKLFYQGEGRSLDVPNLAEMAAKEGFNFEATELLKGVNSDFMERSTLTQPRILLPINFEDEVRINYESVRCRLAHDSAHVYYRDFIFLNSMIIALSVCAYSFTFMGSVSINPGVRNIYVSVNGLFFILLVNRLRLFFHLREYRADLFAYGLLGEAYLNHLKEMKTLERLFVEPGGASGLLKSITHPTFKDRFERLMFCSCDFSNSRWFAKSDEKSQGHTRVVGFLFYVVLLVLAFSPIQQSHASLVMSPFQEIDLQNRVYIYVSLIFFLVSFYRQYKERVRYCSGAQGAQEHKGS